MAAQRDRIERALIGSLWSRPITAPLSFQPLALPVDSVDGSGSDHVISVVGFRHDVHFNKA